MEKPVAIDPDDYLDFSRGEPFSRAEGLAAWELAYAELELQLAARGPHGELYVVFGLQGAGKSMWVQQQLTSAPATAVFFSGPLPSREHRRRALSAAKRHGSRAIGVWVAVPLSVALERNARRRGVRHVPEKVLLHVHEKLESPSVDEGFDEIRIHGASSEA